MGEGRPRVAGRSPTSHTLALVWELANRCGVTRRPDSLSPCWCSPHTPHPRTPPLWTFFPSLLFPSLASTRATPCTCFTFCTPQCLEHLHGEIYFKDAPQ